MASHVAKQDAYAHHIRASKLEAGHVMVQEVQAEVDLHMQRAWANPQGLRKALDCKVSGAEALGWSGGAGMLLLHANRP